MVESASEIAELRQQYERASKLLSLIIDIYDERLKILKEMKDLAKQLSQVKSFDSVKKDVMQLQVLAGKFRNNVSRETNVSKELKNLFPRSNVAAPAPTVGNKPRFSPAAS